MKEDLQFDKLAREKLNDFKVQPPPAIWEGIAAGLKQGNRRKSIFLYRIVSAAAVVLLAVMGGWYFISDSRHTQQASKETTVTREQTKPEILTEKTFDEKIAQESFGKPEKAIQQGTSHGTDLVVKSSSAGQKNSMPATTRESFAFITLKLRKAQITMPFEDDNRLASARSPVRKTVIPLPLSDDEMVKANRQSLRENENRWKLAMFASPGYSSYSASHSDAYARNMTFDGSQSGGNLEGGLSVQYKTGKKWSIESGIYYARNGQKTENSFPIGNAGASLDYLANASGKSFNLAPVNIVQGKLAMNSTAGVVEFSGTPRNSEIAADLEKNGAFSNSLVLQGTISQVFNFMEIPLYARYQLVDSRIGLQLMGGVNTNILVGNNAYLVSGSNFENIGKTGNIRSVSYSGTVGMGLSYNIYRHLSFNVEPRFSYYLNSLSSNSDVDFKPYRIGFYTGISYDF